MKVNLQYGRGELAVELPSERTDLLLPAPSPGLIDPQVAFRAAVKAPLAGPALRERIAAKDRVAVVIPEPHFVAGFSGGYKAIFPGIADLDAITHYHRAAVIADPNSTWAVLEQNQTQQQVRENGGLPCGFLDQCRAESQSPDKSVLVWRRDPDA